MDPAAGEVTEITTPKGEQPLVALAEKLTCPERWAVISTSAMVNILCSTR
jgi:hypothetical protein